MIDEVASGSLDIKQAVNQGRSVERRAAHKYPRLATLTKETDLTETKIFGDDFEGYEIGADGSPNWDFFGTHPVIQIANANQYMQLEFASTIVSPANILVDNGVITFRYYTSTSNNLVVFLRMQDNVNFSITQGTYWLQLPAGGNVQGWGHLLFKWVPWAGITRLAESQKTKDIPLNEWVDVKLELNGTSIKIFVKVSGDADFVEIINVTDDSFNSGCLALNSQSGGIRKIDDLLYKKVIEQVTAFRFPEPVIFNSILIFKNGTLISPDDWTRVGNDAIKDIVGYTEGDLILAYYVPLLV